MGGYWKGAPLEGNFQYKLIAVFKGAFIGGILGRKLIRDVN